MPSPQLYDHGEEDWLLKIHAGCGNIFLTGYINIDLQGTLAHECPELVEANRANISDYYARHADYTDIHHIPNRKPYAVDLKTDIITLDGFADSVADKIVCIQVLEHFTFEDGIRALETWHRVLKDNGILIVSVPDTAETIEMLVEDLTRDFAIQHLAGTRRDIYSYHRNWFTAPLLAAILQTCGFGEIEQLPNFHRYPAIVVKARKQGG